jgi:hypothetical protein
MHTYMHIYIYVYIMVTVTLTHTCARARAAHTHRDRKREREREVCACICMYVYSATVIREVSALLRDGDFNYLAQNALKTLSTSFIISTKRVSIRTYVHTHVYVCIQHIMLHHYLCRIQWNFLSRGQQIYNTKSARAWEITQCGCIGQLKDPHLCIVFFFLHLNVENRV